MLYGRLQYPYLRLSRFQGVSPLQRRENSSQDSCQLVRDRLRYRTEAPESTSISASRFGNINPIPFRPKSGFKYNFVMYHHACFQNGIQILPCRSSIGSQRFSAIHFQDWLIRQVSCYTLLGGFRLPWPPSCCLYQPTPLMGSDER